MQYRPEVDGLRAIAVVPVILFHADFHLFSGGFVGVDVFFVISGYLITTLIIEDLENNRFSLAGFYERRIRRIFPALFLVVLLCIPAAWLLMLPEQFRDFSQSVVSVIFFASNILFWRESGYFDGPSEEKPLLHTWSLAVEEQYYVFFPLLLIFLWRFGVGRTVTTLLLLSVVSIGLMEWGWRNASTANFFLTPFRIWELLAGSICAIWLKNKEPWGSSALGLLGLAMILAAVFTFDRTTPFPSLLAFLPVGGTCLIILFARAGTLPARVLSVPVMVGIGLVSYSAYLWHQPLFAFARIASPFDPTREVMIGLIFLTFILAYLSWRYVEQVFRKKGTPILAPRRNIFALAAVASALLLSAGIYGNYSNGFPGRIDARIVPILDVRKEWHTFRRRCHVESDLKSHPLEGCLSVANGDRIDVAMIGDSHSLAIAEVVQAELKNHGIGSYAVSYTGCIGLRGFYRVDEDSDHHCADYNEWILDFIRDEGIEVVVITSRFPLYLHGWRFDNEEGGREPDAPAYIDRVAFDDRKADVDDKERHARVVAGINDELLRLLEEVKVILVYPKPEAGWDVARYAVWDAMRNGVDNLNISTSYDVYRERNSEILEIFDALEHPDLYRVDPAKLLCDTYLPDRCVNAIGDQIFYRDEDHLSYAGAELLAPLIVDQVEEALATP